MAVLVKSVPSASPRVSFGTGVAFRARWRTVDHHFRHGALVAQLSGLSMSPRWVWVLTLSEQVYLSSRGGGGETRCPVILEQPSLGFAGVVSVSLTTHS